MKAAIAKMAGGGRQRVLSVLTLAAAVAGIVVLAVFFAAQQEPPKATSSGTVASESPDRSPTASAQTGSAQTPKATPGHGGEHKTKGSEAKSNEPLPPSKPTSISIPAIDVKSPVIKIGKTKGGMLAVPKGKNIDKAAWYENSATPGRTGPSVIEGHIDTVDGPSVFYRLGAVEPGDTVKVARADGSRMVFTVTGVRAYPTKERFPTKLVYGGDLSKPSLRLITCSNFDNSTGHYAGNTVVFAKLTGVHKS